MTAALPNSSGSEPSFSRAIAMWRGQDDDAPQPRQAPPGQLEEPERSILAFAPYAFALVLVLGLGAAAASIATAPELNDSIDVVTAIDARAMGLAAELDPTGQQKKSATLTKDVGSLKSEIARLTRALDQSRTNQTALTKQSAGQAASSLDEVKSLKIQIAELQKTLDASREQSTQKIEALAARVEQPARDAARVSELQQRVDRMEREAADKAAKEPAREPAKTATVAPLPRDLEPETTGAIGPRAEPRATDPAIVRNWTVREVSRGVALLEGRSGLIEVVRGARAPGMGRIRSIERRDGQWVVVTDRGLVIERGQL